MSEKHEPFFRVKKEHYKGYEIHMPVQYYGESITSYATIYKDGKLIAETWGNSDEQIRSMYKKYIDDREDRIHQRTKRYLK